MVQVVKKYQTTKLRLVWALMEKGPREEDGDVSSATTVAETISCRTIRKGKRLRRSSIPPREIKFLASFAHTDRLLGWESWAYSRRQRGRQ